jgi:hypothetical protein
MRDERLLSTTASAPDLLTRDREEVGNFSPCQESRQTLGWMYATETGEGHPASIGN